MPRAAPARPARRPTVPIVELHRALEVELKCNSANDDWTTKESSDHPKSTRAFVFPARASLSPLSTHLLSVLVKPNPRRRTPPSGLSSVVLVNIYQERGK
ncbi:hypothetical protein EVAR_10071_1 [Eumeta japonica]|uniref:Uncharacterized protein n=1 Tax=Eumeta variegata TaxID=151549 RepID=A0A4C1TR78_EUMVA|nr:hypothetical protein EVAR_10071_1 [Eumeta japonica]